MSRRDYLTTKTELVEMVRAFPEDQRNRECVYFNEHRAIVNTECPVCIMGNFFCVIGLQDEGWINHEPLSAADNYSILMKHFDDQSCNYLIGVQDMADTNRTWWEAVVD